MKFQQLFLSSFLAIIALVTHSTAEARTWRVELNGSGDFTDIQPAVEASADGDTILIGPGRFDQLHPCVAPAWTEDAIVAVVQDNLTFIGSGANLTVIGMTEYYGSDFDAPKGFCSVESYSATIKDLTIENIETGIYWWRGVLSVENCVIRGSHASFNAAAIFVDGGRFLNCRFEFGGNSIALFCSYTDSLDVVDCIFDGWGQGFTTGASVGFVSFSDCTFNGNRAALAYDFGSSGEIRNTTITNSFSSSLFMVGNVTVDLSNVHITGGEIGILVASSSTLTCTSVVVEGTSSEAFNISSNSSVLVNNSHILPSSGLGVMASAYFGDQFNLDFSGNYWGTTDADSIATMIHDSQDDPSIHCTVQFEPFASGPVSTEKKSLGSLKAMFRDATR